MKEHGDHNLYKIATYTIQLMSYIDHVTKITSSIY